MTWHIHRVDDDDDCAPPLPLTLLTTEGDLLPTRGLALSSVAGASGLFSPNFERGALSYKLGAALTTALNPGSTLDVWLLPTADGATFEYGQATADLTSGSQNITNVVPTDGIWFDGSTPTASAYAFDLSLPADIPVGVYVSAAVVSSTVQLSAVLAADAVGHRLAFVAPPARDPDFTLSFAPRTFVAGEQVWASPTTVRIPPYRFKALMRNSLGVVVPAGGILTLRPAALEVWEFGEGRELRSSGRVRSLI